jgi:hypothetical protein
MAVLSLTMLGLGQYNTTLYQTFLLLVYNTSYSVALYYLLLFYLACRRSLAPFKPVRKFFAVKFVVFATYWQALAINAFPGITEEQAFLWNDTILSVEMVFFAILHAYSFGAREFHQSFEEMPSAGILHSVKDFLSVRDVVEDAYHNFMPSYQEYTLQARDDQERTQTIRTKTFLVGNLDAPDRKVAPESTGRDVSRSDVSSEDGYEDPMQEPNVPASVLDPRALFTSALPELEPPRRSKDSRPQRGQTRHARPILDDGFGN